MVKALKTNKLRKMAQIARSWWVLGSCQILQRVARASGNKDKTSSQPLKTPFQASFRAASLASGAPKSHLRRRLPLKVSQATWIAPWHVPHMQTIWQMWATAVKTRWHSTSTSWSSRHQQWSGLDTNAAPTLTTTRQTHLPTLNLKRAHSCLICLQAGLNPLRSLQPLRWTPSSNALRRFSLRSGMSRLIKYLPFRRSLPMSKTDSLHTASPSGALKIERGRTKRRQAVRSRCTECRHGIDALHLS